MAEAASRDGCGGAEGDTGTGGYQDGGAASGPTGATGESARRDAGRALLLVAPSVGPSDQSRDHESGHRLRWLDPEKKSLNASERSEAARTAWAKRAATVDPSAWVWLDETGSHLGYTPRYAWAPRGQRAYAAAPRNPGENKTLIAALTPTGLGPTLRFDGAMTTDRCVGYVRHLLAPTLRPGQIVVADNLRAHHSALARAAIEARGAEFWPLPSYSPDFNPIELIVAKVKQHLRRAEARTDDDLRAATWAAFATITPDDAAGCLTHCGYRPTDQES
jgi:transposase